MAIVLDGTANTVTPLNGALGGTTPSTVVATTITASGISTLTGNVGIGVTPVSWSDGYKAISCATTGNSLVGVASQTVVTQGARYDSGWKYTISSIGVNQFVLDSGIFTWANAAGGTSGNAATFTERMRLDASGYFLFAKSTTDLATAGIRFDPSGGGINVCNTNSGTQYPIAFYRAGTGSAIGYVSSGASSVTYSTTSDYRLKENVSSMTGALNKVALLKPVTYTWKADGSLGQGFIAHELAEVVPDCVVGEKDAVNEDGSIKPQGIDTSYLVATLTAAIQELNAKFEEYKASHP